jgi:mannose-6-phosphate isomerase-like protein (cupin superfamily)
MLQASVSNALQQLTESNQLFVDVIRHGSMSVELYKPTGQDLQQPHTKDELYIIISGTGNFICKEEKTGFQPGDVLFVPAGALHRFEDFGDDFATWVIFYGPEGGA